MKQCIAAGVVIMLLAVAFFMLGEKLHELTNSAEHRLETQQQTYSDNPLLGTRFCAPKTYRYCY